MVSSADITESSPDMTLASILGARIRALRMDRGLTSAELAQQIGVSRPFISRIENGDMYPRVPTLVKVADVFGVSISELLGEHELRPSAEQQAIELLRAATERISAEPTSVDRLVDLRQQIRVIDAAVQDVQQMITRLKVSLAEA